MQSSLSSFDEGMMIASSSSMLSSPYQHQQHQHPRRYDSDRVIDEYATRVLQKACPVVIDVDTSALVALGDKITSMIRSAKLRTYDISHIQQQLDDQYDSLLELIEDQCHLLNDNNDNNDSKTKNNTDRTTAAMILQEIAKAVVTRQISSSSSSKSNNKSMIHGGLYSLVGGNGGGGSLDSFRSIKDSLPPLEVTTTNSTFAANDNEEKDVAAHHVSSAAAVSASITTNATTPKTTTATTRSIHRDDNGSATTATTTTTTVSSSSRPITPSIVTTTTGKHSSVGTTTTTGTGNNTTNGGVVLPSPLQATTLIPVDLMGALDDPSPHHQQIIQQHQHNQHFPQHYDEDSNTDSGYHHHDNNANYNYQTSAPYASPQPPLAPQLTNHQRALSSSSGAASDNNRSAPPQLWGNYSQSSFRSANNNNNNVQQQQQQEVKDITNEEEFPSLGAATTAGGSSTKRHHHYKKKKKGTTTNSSKKKQTSSCENNDDGDDHEDHDNNSSTQMDEETKELTAALFRQSAVDTIRTRQQQQHQQQQLQHNNTHNVHIVGHTQLTVNQQQQQQYYEYDSSSTGTGTTSSYNVYHPHYQQQQTQQQFQQRPRGSSLGTQYSDYSVTSNRSNLSNNAGDSNGINNNASNNNDMYYQQQIYTCVEILLSTVSHELSEEAAFNAAYMTDGDPIIARYIVETTMKAPPVCRYLVQDGKCYRSDCTFSHDAVDSHTCLFWLRGRCGKGSTMCPYLHGFNPNLLKDIPKDVLDASAAAAADSASQQTAMPSTVYQPPSNQYYYQPQQQQEQQRYPPPSMAGYNPNGAMMTSPPPLSGYNYSNGGTDNHQYQYPSDTTLQEEHFPELGAAVTTKTTTKKTNTMNPYSSQNGHGTSNRPQSQSTSSFSFANVASKGYSSSTNQFTDTDQLSMSHPRGSSNISINNIPTIRIPQDLWNAHENRDASVFHIKDPMERYQQVSATVQRSDVIDLHFQSINSFPTVLEVVLPNKLEQFQEVWIVTGTGNHVGSNTHQKGGGVLENAVIRWLIEEGYKNNIVRGKDRNGVGGAILVKRYLQYTVCNGE